MGWKPFKAIQRAFTPPAPVREFVANATKITGESFQPAEIVRTVGAGHLTLLTGGLAAINPKIGDTVLVSSDPNKASLAGSLYVGAGSFGTVQSGNPDVQESTINQIARKIGGAISAIAVGTAGANVLTTPANALPAGVQGPVQPLSIGQQFGNFGASTISTSATAFGTGQFAQSIIGLFGNKAGTAILQLLSGDIAGVVKTITTPTPNPTTTIPPNLFGNYQSGGGGGGGLGIGVGGNSRQLTSNPLFFPVMGMTVLLIVWLFVRKK